MLFDKLMYFIIICFCIYKILDLKSIKSFNPESFNPELFNPELSNPASW
jgi:hypothetical protein